MCQQLFENVFMGFLRVFSMGYKLLFFGQALGS